MTTTYDKIVEDIDYALKELREAKVKLQRYGFRYTEEKFAELSMSAYRACSDLNDAM